MTAYVVTLRKRTLRVIQRLPKRVQHRIWLLATDLREHGPVQPLWPNYSRLETGAYHCHLLHDWVACWRFDVAKKEVDVYYVGSRQNAPYC